MRLATLYLRSRLTGPVLAGITTVCIAAIALEQRFGDNVDVMDRLLILLPLAVACLVGGSADSPFGELERTASLSLPRVRSFHLAGLVAYGSLALLLVALRWPVVDDSGTLVRNLVGLTGLTLLAAPLVGGRLAWIAPLAQACLVFIFSFGNLSELRLLAWPSASFGINRTLVVALGLLVCGLIAFAIRGERVTHDEALA